MATTTALKNARNRSASMEQDQQSEAAHCRGFRAGAEWSAGVIADRIKQSLDADMSAIGVTDKASEYARQLERIAAETGDM